MSPAHGSDEDRNEGESGAEESGPAPTAETGETAPDTVEVDAETAPDDAAAGDSAVTDPDDLEPSTISVDIFGRRYRIRSDQEPEITRALARYVDRRMRQVSEQVGSGDGGRVAVLAALNIADDYYQARRAFELREREVAKQARTLAEKLREAIEPVLDRRR